MSWRWASLLCVLWAAGCATTERGLMVSSDVALDGSGEGLVAYLSEANASPTVCDLQSTGPHLPTYTASVGEALRDGLVSGKVKPGLWFQCSSVLLRRMPPEVAAAYLELLAPAYRALLLDGKMESNAAFAARADAIGRVYLTRRVGVEIPARTLDPMLAELRGAISRKKLGVVASRLGNELLVSAELERGKWQGKPVDAAVLDALGTAGNEMTLQRMALRLPDPSQRAEASRRIIRIHIRLSAFAEVRDHAAEVETRVLQEGHNALALAGLSLTRAWFEGEAPWRGVVVSQQVWPQTVTLIASSHDSLQATVLSDLKLRGALLVQFAGVSQPVSVCATGLELDVSPCISAKEISVENELLYLDKGARFRFRERAPLSQLLPFARGSGFPVRLRVGGKPALTLDWGLTFARPEDLVFQGPSPGGQGPGLRVEVDHRQGTRSVFHVRAPNGAFAAVVEDHDLPLFSVVSRGGTGFTGVDGEDGSSGSSGGQCQDGGAGGDGGDGGPGGPGGNGGDLLVQVACGQACGMLMPLLQQRVGSAGGYGGNGGSGGWGGSGGSGGPGRDASTHTDTDGNTVTDDPGCSAGSSGPSGSSGASGPNGPAGAPGRASFSVVP